MSDGLPRDDRLSVDAHATPEKIEARVDAMHTGRVERTALWALAAWLRRADGGG